MSGAIYRRSRQAVVDLVGNLDEAGLATPVPATPAWTVRDVLGHLVGGCEDHVSGSDEGAPGDAWTAAHVARLAPLPVHEVLDRWEAVGPTMEAWIDGDDRRWTFSVHDCWVHEHDLRAALEVPRRDDEAAARYSASAVWAVRNRCREAGLPVPAFVVDDEVVLAGDGPTIRFGDLHDVGRVLFGRRSERQVRALDWSEDPGPWLPLLSFFPYPTEDLTG